MLARSLPCTCKGIAAARWRAARNHSLRRSCKRSMPATVVDAMKPKCDGMPASSMATQATARFKPIEQHIRLEGQKFVRDDWTNVPESILSRIGKRLYHKPDHPLGILCQLIMQYLPAHDWLPYLSPITTPQHNFDDLGFPVGHPGRSKNDSYYINAGTMLRTHTSAHEVAAFGDGHERWLLAADVYRRDEIDATHYPIFHQCEGAFIIKDGTAATLLPAIEQIEMEIAGHRALVDDQSTINEAINWYQPHHERAEVDLLVRHLKATLNLLILKLFKRDGQTLQIRWLDDVFPFTSPSFQVEVFFGGKWLELLGCGIVLQRTLDRANVPGKLGWAFGLGLERIAMVLFGIPDIRLFWSNDARFLSQFETGKINQFVPYSKYPACYKDFSFWAPPEFHENDLCDLIRSVAGDLVEDVKLIDNFVHPKTGRTSKCYRTNYRSMDRSLSNEEINDLQKQVVAKALELGLEAR